MIATSTRKRGAVYLLEKPLVSRLPFEVEQPPSICHRSSSTSLSPAPKRLKEEAPATTLAVAGADRDEGLDQHLNGDLNAATAASETSDMQEAYHKEEIESAEVELGTERGWWESGRRSRSTGGTAQERKGIACAGEEHQADLAAAPTPTAVLATAAADCSGGL